MNNIGFGLMGRYLEGRRFICLALQRSARPFEKQGMMCVLKRKSFVIPLEILCFACAYMCYWAGLFPEVTKEAIEEGVDLMLQTTIKLPGRRRRRLGLCWQ
jgi:hypothetical protein